MGLGAQALRSSGQAGMPVLLEGKGAGGGPSCLRVNQRYEATGRADPGKIKISRLLEPSRSRCQEIKPIFLDVTNVTGNGDANHRGASSRGLI